MAVSQLIHLAADLSFLHTDYLWRMPGSWIGYPYFGTSEFYEDIARIVILARGFSAMGNIREFVDFVVPELQRRGLSKNKYLGSTLRENLNN